MQNIQEEERKAQAWTYERCYEETLKAANREPLPIGYKVMASSEGNPEKAATVDDWSEKAAVYGDYMEADAIRCRLHGYLRIHFAGVKTRLEPVYDAVT